MTSFAGEQIRWWKPPGIPGIEALSVRSSPRLWKVYHETFTVCTVLGLEGVSEWDCRGKRHTSSQGSLMLMDQGEVHNTRRVSAPGSFWVLFLDSSFMSRIAEEVLGTPIPRWRFSDFREPGVFRSFAKLHDILQSRLPTLAKETHLQAGISDLLSKAAEKEPLHVSGTGNREGLQRAKDFLHAHYAEDVRLDDLAYHACTARSHLCNTFSRAFGVPPHQYLLRLRIEKAKTLLAKGAPILPSDLGFKDLPQFVRVFKQSYGLTPREYMKQLRVPVLDVWAAQGDRSG